MGVVVKQGLRTAVAGYVGIGLGFLNFLLLFPLVFSPAEIGLVRFVEEVTALLASLMAVGAPSLVVRFFPYFRTSGAPSHGGFLRLVVGLPLVGSVLVGLLCYAAAPLFVAAYHTEPLILAYKHYLVPIGAATAVFLSLEAYLRSNGWMFFPALLRDAIKRALIIAVTLCVWAGWMSFHGFMQGFGAVHLAVLGITLFYLWQVGLWHWQGNPIRHTPPPLRREMIAYDGYMILGSLSDILVNRLDTVLLGAMATLAQTGVYGLAAKLTLLINMPRTALNAVVMPMIAEAFRNNDTAKIADIYRRSAVNQLLVGLLLLLLLWCNIDAVFAIMPNGALYREGRIVVLLLGLTRVVDMSAGVNNEILHNSPYFRANFIIAVVLSVVTAVLNYVFIAWLGFWGAAVAALVAYTLFNTVRGGYLFLKMGIHPLSKEMLWVVVAGGLAYAAQWALPSLADAATIRAGVTSLPSLAWLCLDVAVRSCLVAGLFLYLVVRWRASEEVSGVIMRGLKRVSLKR